MIKIVCNSIHSNKKTCWFMEMMAIDDAKSDSQALHDELLQVLLKLLLVA